MNDHIVLTGIKPTGIPHLGNYFGAIKPALERAQDYSKAFFFIADYHALNTIQDRTQLHDLTISIAATWIAAGLDPEKHNFYRQSDIPEVFELATILSCFTPKSWMNKAHAYKAAISKNENSNDIDAGINMGLYVYPVLMAADILLFNTDTVPVGKDQVQHVEIARDIALRINSHYKKEVFKLPNYQINEDVSTLPGIDGRKMSKSYNNVIPLFANTADWKKVVSRITTDSSGEHDPKDTESSIIYQLFAVLGKTEAKDQLRKDLESGTIGWGTAKQRLVSVLEENFGELSKRYDDLLQNPEHIETILSQGAKQVRPLAKETMQRVRNVIGIN